MPWILNKRTPTGEGLLSNIGRFAKELRGELGSEHYFVGYLDDLVRGLAQGRWRLRSKSSIS
jgi:hypothetical protein